MMELLATEMRDAVRKKAESICFDLSPIFYCGNISKFWFMNALLWYFDLFKARCEIATDAHTKYGVWGEKQGKQSARWLR